MELDRLTKSQITYWKSKFSDLQNVGILRGRATTNIEHAPKFDAQVKLLLTAAPLRQLPVPLETALHAAWAVVLSRHTGASEILFCCSFDETRPWLAPLRVSLPPKTVTSSWLAEFGNEFQTAQENGPLSAEVWGQFQEDGLDRSLATFVIVQPHAKTFPPRNKITGPLLVVVRLDLAEIELYYDSAWFDEIEIRALGNHLNIILQGMVANPETPLGQLPILTEQELHQVLHKWNDTTVPFGENTCIHQFFEQQAAQTPDAVAVVFCDRQWTYRELDAQADLLARRLKAVGAGPGTFVAICLNRSLELMASLFAILKTGAAYVPLDPTYPAERLTFMIEDAKPAVIVVSQQTASLLTLPGRQLFLVDEACDEAGLPFFDSSKEPSPSSNPAYVLYTSGSTGKPKGVVITHRNVSNFFTAMDAVIGTKAGVWLAVTSINFDISVLELFWTLARGFRVILQEEGPWGSQAGSAYSLPNQIKLHGVTHLQCTPSLASMLIGDSESAYALRPLQRFMVGGEPLPLDLARQLSNLIVGELINLYGPTETTVWSSAQVVGRQEQQILIGQPVANTRFYVLNAERELVPLGSVGELYIGGDGLAREYLHRPDITEERFIHHSFSPSWSERLYRTGDLVRYARDGRLEFMGRIDQQIKIRGVRIELGEIESVLREHPSIREAVVVVRANEVEDQRLVAYVLLSTQERPKVTRIQQWLGTKLPKMLVPSAIVYLDEFPQTPNGKLDRRALPSPEQRILSTEENESDESETQMEASSRDAIALDKIEKNLVRLWQKHLGLKRADARTDFFEAGGHSLMALRLFGEIRLQFRINFGLSTLFEARTVGALAELIHRAQENDAFKKGNSFGHSLVTIRSGEKNQTPLFLVHDVGGGLLRYEYLAGQFAPGQPILGIESQGLRGLPTDFTVEDMAKHYIEIIRQRQPEGPYYIVGHSFGGLVAYEIARQLKAQNEPVGLVGLLDSYLRDSDETQKDSAKLKTFKTRRFFQKLKSLVLGKDRIGYLLEKRSFVKAWLTKFVFRLVFKLTRQFGYRMPSFLNDVKEANWIATDYYKPRSYEGSVVLFRSVHRLRTDPPDSTHVWQRLVKGNLTILDIPGDHNSILREPNVKVLAVKIAPYLNRSC